MAVLWCYSNFFLLLLCEPFGKKEMRVFNRTGAYLEDIPSAMILKIVRWAVVRKEVENCAWKHSS